MGGSAPPARVGQIQWNKVSEPPAPTQPTGQAGQAPVPQHDWNRRQIARHSRSPVVFAQGVEIVVVEDAGNDDFREFGQGQTGIKPVVVAT